MSDQTTGQPGDGLALGDGAVTETSGVALVSRAMIAIYKDQFGRGPTKVHTHWCSADLLICVLEETLTRAEKNLQRMGEYQRLRDIRTLFQYATERDFIEPVEQITGRRVRSFISGIDAQQDVSVETFLLYPAGENGVSRADMRE